MPRHARPLPRSVSYYIPYNRQILDGVANDCYSLPQAIRLHPVHPGVLRSCHGAPEPAIAAMVPGVAAAERGGM